MEKIYVYSSESLEEYPYSNLSSIELEVELFNRDKSEEKKKKIHQGIAFPPEGFKFECGALKELSLSEKADRGLTSVPENMKIEEETLVPKTELELLQCGFLTISAYKEKKIQKIKTKFDEAMDQILSKYPKTEPLSWPILAPQAKRWIYASAEEKESLKSEFIFLISESKSQNDEDITELASSILTKSNAYESFSGVCKKLKREMILQIENNTKTNVNVLYNELEAIVINFPSFEGDNHG
ncbi:hypothetical protein Q2295_09385 [Leptospira interrogans]|uniref:Uncharacterized protein n=1 Tax=Leptospira interrogans serovar Pomona TaxID=44276 RepID=A0AA41BHB2_LEPIR|nr:MULTISPECIES: hypothetical protein [Leptospira]EJO76893.1 hypothetical protein LEP1GSC045_2711 [Leptospira interrogans serovar Pomona str. Kennewicki LC82-25]EKN96172.1 hypothetical protein LEP1GSC014_3211 [Leptospira interrogans serovar Pomona str. Pomona]EKR35709.1 hypothetical protein LEP1GSC096_3897 [Leptospira interrogans serovar Hebdomadis str. R499]EMF31853.1 hypothetical protein LEP1GSC201_0957 [Leptospira interrogans serovar Pomona str. Fox 32256]EMI63126.1 hypothetical protein LEP